MAATAFARKGIPDGSRPAHAWDRSRGRGRRAARREGDDCRPEGRSVTLGALIGAIARVVTLPLRVLAMLFTWMGRLASLLLGFLLMVGGAALLAGPLMLVGVPVFLFGLFLTLRALG